MRQMARARCARPACGGALTALAAPIATDGRRCNPSTRTMLLHESPSPAPPISATAGPFDEADIRRCLPGRSRRGALTSGRGAVRELRADKGGQRLIASVQGTRPRPYHVVCRASGQGEPVLADGPMQLSRRVELQACRGGAAGGAAKAAAVEQAAADPLDGPIGGWLEQLRQAARRKTRRNRGDRLSARSRRAQPGMPFMLEAAHRPDPQIGRLGRRPAAAAFAELQNPTANYLSAGGPRDRPAAAQRRALELGCRLPGRPGRRRPADAPHARDRPMPLAEIIGSPPLAWGRRGAAGSSGASPITALRRSTVAARRADRRCRCPAPRPGMSLPGEHSPGRSSSSVARPSVEIALSAPPVTATQAAAVADALDARIARAWRCRGRAPTWSRRSATEPPVPTLRLATRKRGWSYWDSAPSSWDKRIDLALLGYSYGGQLDRSPTTPARAAQLRGRPRHRAPARSAAERAAQQRLRGVRAAADRDDSRAHGRWLELASLSAFRMGRGEWPGFVYDARAAAGARRLADRDRGRVSAIASSMAAASGPPRSRRAAAGGSRSISGSRSTASACRCCRC